MLTKRFLCGFSAAWQSKYARRPLASCEYMPKVCPQEPTNASEPDAIVQCCRDRSARITSRGVLPVHRRKACEKEPTSR